MKFLVAVKRVLSKLGADIVQVISDLLVEAWNRHN